MQVEINLTQLIKFLRDWGPIKWRCLNDVEGVLHETLENKVFTKHDDTVRIETKDDLRRYIRSSRGHNPPHTPQKGAPYNEEYLKRKSRLGENRPHKYMNHGFWNNIDIRTVYNKVRMTAEMPETSDKDFNYLLLHEKNRSVLKTAFLRGWGDIVKTIIRRLARELTVP